jgi:hypothetical protein
MRTPWPCEPRGSVIASGTNIFLIRYGERCAFSGVQPPQVLEAAHLYSFAKRPEHRRDSGLILRRDYHALFDAKLVAVNPESLKIEIAPRLFDVLES